MFTNKFPYYIQIFNAKLSQEEKIFTVNIKNVGYMFLIYLKKTHYKKRTNVVVEKVKGMQRSSSPKGEVPIANIHMGIYFSLLVKLSFVFVYYFLLEKHASSTPHGLAPTLALFKQITAHDSLSRENLRLSCSNSNTFKKLHQFMLPILPSFI